VEAGLNNQGGDQQYWNGNISAIKWKGFGTGSDTEGQRSYKYQYDKSDKLKQATFQAFESAAWSKESNTLNEALAYDANGTIKTLERNHNLRGLSGTTVTSAAEAIDDLSYTYATGSGNRLTKVEDGAIGSAAQAGFVNGASTTTEYTYDVNGSLTADHNKGISGIAYNILGKPSIINFADGRKIEYTYDATGSKLTMKNYLFAGSHNGARRAAMLYSFLGTCKINGTNPFEWLSHVLNVIPTHPVNKLQQLLPNNCKM
jgi:hypothetical protein